jgi:predicted nuclease of restriction endonuclease-like RecB superfamily
LLLPSNLFSAKVLKGKVSPRYLALDDRSVALAREMIGIFGQSLGKKRAFLTEKLEQLEGGRDYKVVRGLAAILDRRCTYVVDSKLEPMSARTTVFEEASNRRVATLQERDQLLVELGTRMNVSAGELEESLFKDLEEEQILSSFDSAIEPKFLVKIYNLSLAQTALFKSVSMEFIASGNWKRIFRDIKRLGLMYSVEKTSAAEYTVYLDGPLSLFKMTERYGTSLAKLLPSIVSGDSWSFKAELVDRHKNNRILHFEENSSTAPVFASFFEESSPIFDSSVEEKFASSFNSLNTGWELRREPEPLIAGRHVMIPDFSFEKYGIKLFMEIVGFWTKEYIDRKLSKLSSLSPDTVIIVAVNETLRCSESKLSAVKASLLLTYSKEVPLEPILSHLRMLEQKVEERQVEQLRNSEGFGEFKGDSVNLQEVANACKVSLQILKRVLAGSPISGYRIIGDHLLSESKMETIRKELVGSDLTLNQAVHVIESLGAGGANPEEVLRSLGYDIEWNGLDYERSKVKKAVIP